MLAIAGGKGGCGKTTTALGVGAALPGRPIVADADWDLPNLHRLAEGSRDGPGQSEPLPRTGADDVVPTGADDVVPTGDCDVDRGIEPIADRDDAVAVENVRIDPLGQLGLVAAPATPDEHDVAAWLHRVRKDRVERDAAGQRAGRAGSPDGLDSPGQHRPIRDRVLVDCPAGASPDATEPLSVADATLLVTTPRPAAIRDTMKTAAMARALDAAPVGTVVVGADSTPSGLGAALEAPVAGCVPTVAPPVLAHPEVARAYRAVASRLTDVRRTQRGNP